ncbi:hypothetical protein TELCIR_04060 [Teladorsagia circumcincta]|uniref:Uncharacterized protein n=1 Tax=Teladorsagia circumcincta TaxID=45464 RepID=A0A2G9UUN1_TELCI|nr:hypothetical protein TELCIR_04060 [Teladorsagia circumcincta]
MGRGSQRKSSDRDQEKELPVWASLMLDQFSSCADRIEKALTSSLGKLVDKIDESLTEKGERSFYSKPFFSDSKFVYRVDPYGVVLLIFVPLRRMTRCCKVSSIMWTTCSMTSAMSSKLKDLADKVRGWKLVQKTLPRIIEYGRAEGILQTGPPTGGGLNITGVVLAAQEEAHTQKETKSGDKVVNLLVGVSQFFTITFLFVGWFWSIAWGGLLIIHSMQYREALQQRRQEAVATAAIEALTKDSILHRRDVKTLVKTHKQQAKDKKTAVSESKKK